LIKKKQVSIVISVTADYTKYVPM